MKYCKATIIFLMYVHPATPFKNLTWNHLFNLPQDLLISPPLPWVPFLDIFSEHPLVAATSSDFTHTVQGSFGASPRSLPSSHRCHSWWVEGGSSVRAICSQSALVTLGKCLYLPILSFILVKMQIIIIAALVSLLWGLNELIVSGTQ